MISLVGFVPPSGAQEPTVIQRGLEEGKPLAVDENSPAIDNAPKTIAEARIRARLLHESFSGALQVMHRDFFREDQKLTLPSKSLEDVFAEMSRSQNVELRWLAVNANAMSQSHTPQNEFEKSVVKSLSSGKEEYESASPNLYRFAGSIRLSASCVKCHVRNRTSNAARKAALVITMPIQAREKN